MYLAFWKEGRRGGSSELARQHGLGTPVTEAKAGPLELRRKRAEDTHLRKEGGGRGRGHALGREECRCLNL